MKYFLKILRHKFAVLYAGLLLKAPLWNLIIHDWTKFLPNEFIHYKRYFCENGKNPEKFNVAWLHHQNHNPHHYEYWLLRTNQNKQIENNKCMYLPMPEKYIREMVADWYAASRIYNGRWPSMKTWTWWKNNQDYIKNNVHEETWKKINEVLDEAITIEFLLDLF